MDCTIPVLSRGITTYFSCPVPLCSLFCIKETYIGVVASGLVVERSVKLKGLVTQRFHNSQVYRPFSKMVAENSNKLKLAKIKHVYQH